MGLNDTEPQRAPGPAQDLAQEIRDSFQAVLDALDAARADLYASDENDGWAESAPPSCMDVVRRPPVVPPAAEEPPLTGGVRGAGTPQHVAVEPLWSRGVRPEPVPPPSPAQPRTASGAGPAHATPPLDFPPPAAVQEGAYRRTVPPPENTLPMPLQHRVPPSDRLLDPCREAPTPRAPVRGEDRRRGWRRFTALRSTRVAGAFSVGAVSGLMLASWLLAGDSPPPAVPSPPSAQPDRPLPDTPAPSRPDTASLPEIPGTGVLREGDSGHGVYELQVRLLQVPNVYDGGAIDGRYGTEVRAAVARFQEWYGIRGDETGVYGDRTRHALMLRTT